MKQLHYNFIGLIGIIGLISFFSFSEGYAHKNNGGITTAPFDLVKVSGESETCAKCHMDNQFDASIDISIKDANNTEIIGYDPGAPYKIHVKINHSMNTPSGYGFQMVGLLDDTGTGLQNFTGHSSNTQEILAILGRKYYEHMGTSATNEFTIDWVAPADNSGSVTFYAVGNAVNGNGTASGDSPCNVELSLSEGLLLSNKIANEISEFQILGNPILDEIYMEIKATINHEANFTLYDLAGQQVSKHKRQLNTGSNQVILDVANIETGAYFLVIRTPIGQRTQKLMIH